MKKFTTKNGEQIVHICWSVYVIGDLIETNICEQEVTQSRELGEKKMTPQQLRQLERFQKPNSEYVSVVIVEFGVNEPDTYEEPSQNTTWQKATEEEI